MKIAFCLFPLFFGGGEAHLRINSKKIGKSRKRKETKYLYKKNAANLCNYDI